MTTMNNDEGEDSFNEIGSLNVDDLQEADVDPSCLSVVRVFLVHQSKKVKIRGVHLF